MIFDSLLNIILLQSTVTLLYHTRYVLSASGTLIKLILEQITHHSRLDYSMFGQHGKINPILSVHLTECETFVKHHYPPLHPS